jgi:hypothetical protein
MIRAPPISIAGVSLSFSSVAPRMTATTGFTYGYVATVDVASLRTATL